jgi:hypothetical protein
LAFSLLNGCSHLESNRYSQLQNWIALGDAGWENIDQQLVSTNAQGAGFLVSRSSWDDFELNLEFNPGETVNSGIFIRCQDPNDITPTNCYEINIWDDHPQQAYRTGAIVIHASPPLAHLTTVGQWNHYRIIAAGEQVKVWLNDTLTASFSEAELSSGHLALQSKHGQVRFRNIRVSSP